MKDFRTTEKKFKVIDLNTEEMLKLHSPCICDSCNKAMFSGVFIGALGNKIYCQECYDGWHGRAKFYPEDQPYENKVITRTLQILNS